MHSNATLLLATDKVHDVPPQDTANHKWSISLSEGYLTPTTSFLSALPAVGVLDEAFLEVHSLPRRPRQRGGGTLQVLEKRRRHKLVDKETRSVSVPPRYPETDSEEGGGRRSCEKTVKRASSMCNVDCAVPLCVEEEELDDPKMTRRSKLRSRVQKFKKKLSSTWAPVSPSGKPPPFSSAAGLGLEPDIWTPLQPLKTHRRASFTSTASEHSGNLYLRHQHAFMVSDPNEDRKIPYLPPTNIYGCIQHSFDAILQPNESSTVLRIKDVSAVNRKPTLLELSKPPTSVSKENGRTPTPTSTTPPTPTPHSPSVSSTHSCPSLSKLSAMHVGGGDQITVAKKRTACLPASMILAKRAAGETLFNKIPHRGIEYLIHHGFLSENPEAIAKFLISENLSRRAIGEYVGRISDPLAVSVVKEFVNRLDLHDLEVDEALRQLFSYVHPEGESQKLEFLLQALKESYVQQNREKVAAEFCDTETIAVLAYSIMMLHTGFFNPSVRKHAKPMTCIEFIHNNRGIDAGKNISPELLQGIYKRVAASEFKTRPDVTDRLREVDQLFTGSLKSENFLQRHRRFVCWMPAFDVGDLSTRRPLITRTIAQLRGLFIFNDTLVISKPLRTNAVNELMSQMPASQNSGDLLPTAHRRLTSLDRLVGRMTNSPVPFINPTGLESCPRNKLPDYETPNICSTKLPVNCLFHICQVIPLENVELLLFASENSKFGVQLQDDKHILINLNVLHSKAQEKLIQILHECIAETKELLHHLSNSTENSPVPLTLPRSPFS